MNQEQLQAILAAHSKWLRNEKGGVRANLTWANLAGADLSMANLSRADLATANLTGANLTGANLTGANLARANLAGVRLSNTVFNQTIGLRYWTCCPGKHTINAVEIDGIVQVWIGCRQMTLPEWIDQYQKIGEESNYTEAETEVYGEYLRMASKLTFT